MTWQAGYDRVAELIKSGELEQIASDRQVADRLMEDARRHIESAAAAVEIGDLSGAYQLAYDALRKSAAALLALQGLRATSRGGHVAIQETVVAQFGSSVRVIRSFGRIRRARNRFEYPDTDTGGPTIDDVDDAVTTAAQARQAVVTIVEQGILKPWL